MPVLLHRMVADSVRAMTCILTSVTVTPALLVVTGVHGAAGAVAARLVTEVRCGATGPATTPDLLMEAELVQALIHRYRDAAQPPALLMVTGGPGSRGENALRLVEAGRGLVSDSVTVRLTVMEADRVQETPPSCPGATRRPAQVDPRKLEEALSGTSMISSLASPSLMPPSQTATPAVESSKQPFLMYRGH